MRRFAIVMGWVSHHLSIRATLVVSGYLMHATAGLGSELLHTQPGAGGASNTPFDRLIYTLFYAGPQGPNPVPPWPVRFGELSINVLPAQGTSIAPGTTFVFNALNTESFLQFAELATNGSDHDILVNGIETGFGGSWSASEEALYGWSSARLYNLDEVRLVVHYLTFLEDRTWHETSFHWEFWGHVVPEPGCLIAVLILSWYGFNRRREYHR